MTGREMALLGRRLRRRYGFDVHRYRYPTRSGDALAAAAGLAELARSLASDGRRVHYVGHSLGGAVVYRALTDCGAPGSGNAVVIGSPLNGCRCVGAVGRRKRLKRLLGSYAHGELAEPPGPRAWAGPCALGAIAGSKAVGAGRIFADFAGCASDGTVAIDETVIPGLADHLVVPHSHTGLIFSRGVAAQVAHFLREGRFSR